MEKVYLHGLMEENMKGNIKTIKKKDLVYLTGQMVRSIEDKGEMVNTMEKANFIFHLIKNGKKESGKKENE